MVRSDGSADAEENQDISNYITADTPEGQEFAEALREETADISIDGDTVEVDDG